MFDKLKDEIRNTISRLRPAPWKTLDRVRVVQEISAGFDQQLWIGAVQKELPDWRGSFEFQFVSDSLSLHTAVRDAQVVSTLNLSTDLVRTARRAQWLNTLYSGVSQIALSQVDASVKVTTSRGIAASSMAEYALLYYLGVRNNLPRALRNQGDWKWSEQGLLCSHAELGSQTVAVFGLGAAGSAVLGLFKSIGMRTIGVTRSPEAAPPVCDEVCAISDFRSILPRADLLVLTLPLTTTTRKIFGDAEFQRMKPSAIVVNVSRGGLIDEAALARALRSGTIGGAGLDVLSEEPPTTNHPLRDCPNLIITPHVSGNIQKFQTEIAARFARNLRAFTSAQPLEGLISSSSK